MTYEAGNCAEALLRALAVYVENCDEWEIYYAHVIKSGEDAEWRSRLMVESTRPMLQHIRDEGFRFEDMFEIIPTAFKTTEAERHQILSDLTTHVYKTYDTEIPF